MSPSYHLLKRAVRQDGTAAVEMALLSFVIAAILMAPIMVTRSLNQVTLAQRAAFNAAHILATYPQYQRLDAAVNPASEAKDMLVNDLLAEGIAGISTDNIGIYCANSLNCQKAAVPTEIDVSLSLDVLNPTLTDFSTVEVALGAHDRYGN